MSGTAVDDRAASGSGISNVEVFLGSRDAGGLFLGSTSVTGGAPGAWSVLSSIPGNVSGGQNLFVYGTSAVSGQQAFVSIPVVIAQSPSAANPVSDQSGSFCPVSIMPTAVSAPTSAPPAPPVAEANPTLAPTIQPAAPTPEPTVQPVASPTPLPANPPAAAAAAQPTPVELAISSPASPPLSFDMTTLTATAGAPVTVTFTNDEPDVPHSWHLFDGPDSSAPTLAATQIITGPGTSDTVSFTAPTQTGDYFFWCDVHPTIMTGTFVVTSDS